jgi:PP-loop superfamily ATP-utilizing enzyme
MVPDTFNKKYESLKQILKGLGKVVVAYSGGVDIVFLFKMSIFAKA